MPSKSVEIIVREVKGLAFPLEFRKVEEFYKYMIYSSIVSHAHYSVVLSTHVTHQWLLPKLLRLNSRKEEAQKSQESS